jgi:hypothetical protein
MDQRLGDRTISAEESLNRLSTVQLILYSVLLSLPIIGLVIGFAFAITMIVFVLARSKNVMRDLVHAAVAILVGFSCMIGETILIISGQVILSIAADAVLNYLILTMLLNKKLGHVFSKP